MNEAPMVTQHELARLTSDIVAAYVTNNKLASDELPSVIAAVHVALRDLDRPKEVEPEKPVPMISAKKSITPDHLISLEDGRRYKSLKRHLSGRGLTPAQYREKWGLAKDYPMVAPNYAKQRSELARALGLGQQRRKRPLKEGDAANGATAELGGGAETPAPPRKRGRPRSATRVESAA